LDEHKILLENFFTLVASAVYSGSLRYVKDVPESMMAANSTGADSLPTLIVVKLTLYVGLPTGSISKWL
jgi:hypothetical protein